MTSCAKSFYGKLSVWEGSSLISTRLKTISSVIAPTGSRKPAEHGGDNHFILKVRAIHTDLPDLPVVFCSNNDALSFASSFILCMIVA